MKRIPKRQFMKLPKAVKKLVSRAVNGPTKRRTKKRW